MKDEAQFAKKIAEMLDRSDVDAATAKKLASARAKAVASMAQPVQVTALSPVAAGWNQLVTFSHEGGYRFWVPVVVLFAALLAGLGSTFTHNNDPIDADALLLASDLPPEAYADKEFVAWLEQSSQL